MSQENLALFGYLIHISNPGFYPACLSSSFPRVIIYYSQTPKYQNHNSISSWMNFLWNQSMALRRNHKLHAHARKSSHSIQTWSSKSTFVASSMVFPSHVTSSLLVTSNSTLVITHVSYHRSQPKETIYPRPRKCTLAGTPFQNKVVISIAKCYYLFILHSPLGDDLINPPI